MGGWCRVDTLFDETGQHGMTANVETEAVFSYFLSGGIELSCHALQKQHSDCNTLPGVSE